MATSYAPLDRLKKRCGIDDDVDDDAELVDASAVASRWIDGFCYRRFDLDATVQVRYFEADDPNEMQVDDIGSTDGLVVQTDENADGSFERTLALDVDFELLPRNAPQEIVPRPWTALRMIGAYTFPLPPGAGYRRELVKVTSRGGWPATPSVVTGAALILAEEHFKLKDAPFGVAGANDFGPLRVGPQTMNRAMAMLETADLRKGPIR